MKFNKLKTVLVTSLVALSVLTATSVKAELSDSDYLNPKILDKFSLNTIYSYIKATNDQQFSYITAIDIATSVHYNHPTFKGTEMSNKILSYYLSYPYAGSLDPQKLFFTKQDIDSFKSKYLTLDANGYATVITKVQVAFDIYQVYAKRASDFYRKQAQYILSLKNPINLNTNIRVPNIENAQWRDEHKQSLEEKIKIKTIDDLIALKLDKPGFTWDQLRARLIRSLLWRARVLNNYDQVNPFKVYMNALSKALDTHSDFYPAESDFTEQLAPDIVGIGVGITQDVNGIVSFPNIIKDGPAARQGGLNENDELEEVSQDGKRWTPVDDLKLDQIVNLIKGKINTKVYLKVLDAKTSKEKIVTIVRGRVPKADTVAKLETFKDTSGAQYGVLKFGSFYQGADRDIRLLLKNNPNLQGLIIDLRENGGGLVDEVLGIADTFLPTFSSLFQTNDSPAQLRGSQRNIRPTRAATPNVKFDKPLIVLTSQLSASASEILAAAIQDYKRGLIVGNRTFGKGTVQAPSEITPFGNDGVLKLTIQKFFRVNGQSTQFKGVSPDIVFPDTMNRKYDEQGSINPLPYTFINATKYQPYSGLVTSEIVSSLQSYAKGYLNNITNAREYVNGIKRSIEIDNRKETVLNYKQLQGQKLFRENFLIKNYNIYAKEHNKPTISSIEEYRRLSRHTDTFQIYDPYLDLSKKLLVKYAQMVNTAN